MIIQNGTIEYILESGGALDNTTGFPIAPSETKYGEPIPCQYQASRYNAIATANGETVTEDSYTILIEQFWHIESGRIRLRSRSGRIVGDFTIKQIEPLDTVCQNRIIV